MLQSLQSMRGYAMEAEDRDFGAVSDFLFNTGDWAVWYVTARTHRFWPGGRVIVPSVFFGAPDPYSMGVPVSLTSSQIRKAFSHSGAGRGALAVVCTPREHLVHAGSGRLQAGNSDGFVSSGASETQVTDQESCLLSAVELLDYRVSSTERIEGNIVDLVIDDRTWAIKYLAVSLSGSNAKVAAIEVYNIVSVHSGLRLIATDLTGHSLRNCPEFDLWEPNSGSETAAGRVNEVPYNCLWDESGRRRFGMW